MDVAAWLRDLGLERYAAAFAANDIDAQTLPTLTEADLAEIGVASVGHRRKLAVAIAALALRPEPVPPRPLVAADAERRQVSVLYCAMRAGAQSSPLQAEVLREAIKSFYDACTRIVAEFDGHLANFYGDCILAYFGWPRAHEDDAERAVRAGLAMVQQLRQPGARSESLWVHAGIATGEVVVGDLIREGPASEQSAVGLAPNLGARMLGVAKPWQVVIDEATRQLLPPSFAVQSLGRQVLKGISEPVEAHAVLGERAADSRFDARRARELAPMFGREHELALLLERWGQVQGGEGQAVLLVGEAGIGKSRLTSALLDGVAGQAHAAVRWQCSPYHSGSALWPVIQRVSRAAGLGEHDNTEQALDKLETTVGGAETAALYATLLGLDGEQRYGPLHMTPQMLRERTLELLVEQLFEMARQRPLLLMLEDAHWIDPTTLELLERCLERVDEARVLVVVTSRPDNLPKLVAHPSVTQLSLNRLSRSTVAALVAHMGGGRLNTQTVTTIVAQTDGVPLFVEELTKAVLETGEATIPASLQGSLIARLDRIPEVKEVAQIAACIGREFDLALVQAVAERPEAVHEALNKLADAELVFRRGERTNPKYTFKHALVQEAAYESLLRGKRQRIHARIVEALEAARKETPPEVLARHAEQAQQVDKAIGHWSRAGDDALAKSAYVEAAGFLGRAALMIQAQIDGGDRRAVELDLQLRLGQACISAHGFGADATKSAFLRARELLELNPNEAALGSSVHVQYGLWAWHVNRGEFKESLRLATEALAAVPPDGSGEARLCILRLVAVSHMYLGEFAQAGVHFEQALTLVDAASRGELTAWFAIDPGIAILYCFALALCLQGAVPRSGLLTARALDMGATLPQAGARAHLHLLCGLQAACGRDTSAVRHHMAALAALSDQHRLLMYGGYADVLRSFLPEVPKDEAVALCERGLGKLSAVGSRMFIPFFVAHLATLLAACERLREAVSAIDDALAESEQMSHGWCEAELWRVRGDLYLRQRQPDHVQAARSFERALAIARSQGAKLWELRAAASLARLWLDRGDRAMALELLAPVYDGFIQGFDTADMLEARALLAALGHLRSNVRGDERPPLR